MDHDYRRLINPHDECILVGRRSASGEAIAGRENRREDWSNDHARVGLYDRHSVNRGAEQNGVEGAVSILVSLTRKPAVGFGVMGGAPGKVVEDVLPTTQVSPSASVAIPVPTELPSVPPRNRVTVGAPAGVTLVTNAWATRAESGPVKLFATT